MAGDVNSWVRKSALMKERRQNSKIIQLDPNHFDDIARRLGALCDRTREQHTNCLLSWNCRHKG